MLTLDRDGRKQLERTVVNARRAAEDGSRKALEQLAVHLHEPFGSMTPLQRQLRNRLRAHGRQLGDKQLVNGRQEIVHLAEQYAYQHWHRMLFARFLAENELLIEPESGVPISIDECRELAMGRSLDWRTVASAFAERMLPQIFRAGDPVLDVVLPPETRAELEALLDDLPAETFIADDALGWVYQFWQRERKDEVNASGDKIGADELPAVTQLFTEDYMVLFLLHNTLGAWWAAKREAAGRAHSLPDYEWSYLRLNEDGTPAAGGYKGWPEAASKITVLDPCMGSGHFLVFALPILVGFRMEEEGLSRSDAVYAVLRDNLFGLEIDARCTQIAAFNLALAAWRLVGHCALPSLNLACSGLGINAKQEEWLALAGGQHALRNGMQKLYELFQQASTLGSLIDPATLGTDVALEQVEAFEARFGELKSMLEQALKREAGNETVHELAVTAHGVAKAADLLARRYTLVATNVPFLGRPDQCESLKAYCDIHHHLERNDLAACFVARSLSFLQPRATAALVSPQSWFNQPGYAKFRTGLLRDVSVEVAARLGARAFETIGGERVNVTLCALTATEPSNDSATLILDADGGRSASEKRALLKNGVVSYVPQESQQRNPDSIFVFERVQGTSYLSTYAFTVQGFATSDNEPFVRHFWEFPSIGHGWTPAQSAPQDFVEHGGRTELLLWENGEGAYHRHALRLKKAGRLGGWKSGQEAWGRAGVLVSEMGRLAATLYMGEMFDHTAHALLPRDFGNLAPIWCFASSSVFREAIRKVSSKLNITNETLVKVPFDLAYWQHVAAEKYPRGLPKPHSDNSTQWLFNGHPRGAEQPLQVAVARLVGYRWPRQTGFSFPDCDALEPDGLESHADSDGIVALNSLRGDASAGDRIRALLAAALGDEWSPAKEREFIAVTGSTSKSLEEWLRDDFFQQHCTLFEQRPFVWHIWDGRRDGFHALVNYHWLSAPNGEGRRTLEKLTYAYLGDWIARVRAEQAAAAEAADARLAAALHLKGELEKVLEGEPPYDLFVRWTPLHDQAIGWEPDIKDGVRINIRPFMTARPIAVRARGACILRTTPRINWGKDRGTEPEREKPDFPWFWGWDETLQDFLGGRGFDGNRWNDLHYSRAVKDAARVAACSPSSRPQ